MVYPVPPGLGSTWPKAPRRGEIWPGQTFSAGGAPDASTPAGDAVPVGDAAEGKPSCEFALLTRDTSGEIKNALWKTYRKYRLSATDRQQNAANTVPRAGTGADCRRKIPEERGCWPDGACPRGLLCDQGRCDPGTTRRSVAILCRNPQKRGQDCISPRIPLRTTAGRRCCRSGNEPSAPRRIPAPPEGPLPRRSLFPGGTTGWN
jgi:hypothetical protein